MFEGEFHYLPHHGVVRQESETTKLRIVYNGSAKAVGDDYSLNDCLLTGPNCVPNLFSILIQFRWNLIAVTADIEKAFFMVLVSSQVIIIILDFRGLRIPVSRILR